MMSMMMMTTIEDENVESELLKQLRQIIPRSNGKNIYKILRSWEKLNKIIKKKRENAKDVVVYLCMCVWVCVRLV